MAKLYLLLLCQMCNINSTSRGEGVRWPQNRRNSLPCTVRISRQISCNQRFGCSMARIYDFWDGSLDQCNVCGSGNAIVNKKQVQLFTMHRKVFQTEVVQSYGWLSAMVEI